MFEKKRTDKSLDLSAIKEVGQPQIRFQGTTERGGADDLFKDLEKQMKQ